MAGWVDNWKFWWAIDILNLRMTTGDLLLVGEGRFDCYFLELVAGYGINLPLQMQYCSVKSILFDIFSPRRRTLHHQLSNRTVLPTDGVSIDDRAVDTLLNLLR